MTFKYDVNAPGHLKRLKKYYEYMDAFSEGASFQERYNMMVDWLAMYITEPADPAEAREALENATPSEIEEFRLACLQAGIIPPKKDENSDGG